MKRQVMFVGRAFLWALGGLLALVLVALAVGWVLPVEHTATLSRAVPAPVDSVWSWISEPEGFPAWREDVRTVEMLNAGGAVRWREMGRDGPLTMEVVSAEPPTSLETRIVDEDLPFGGSWVHRLEPEGSGTRVTITEHGEVYSPVFRFVSRFVMGHTATMERYLDGLERRARAGRSP